MLFVKAFAAEGGSYDPPQRAGGGRRDALHARAQKEGWEGLIAKDAASTYQPGRRSPAWRKIKLAAGTGIRRRRLDRAAADAAVLRRAAARRLRATARLKYVGHTGTGFDQKELARVSKLLKAREDQDVPFAEKVEDQRTGALGAARSRRADPLHRMDRRRQAAASGLSRAARRQGRRRKSSEKFRLRRCECGESRASLSA